MAAVLFAGRALCGVLAIALACAGCAGSNLPSGGTAAYVQQDVELDGSGADAAVAADTVQKLDSAGDPDAGAATADAADAPAPAPDVPPDVQVDAGTPGFSPAAHAPPPTVLEFGGAVLSAPKVVPVFFAGAAMQADMTKFLGELAGSPYWSAVTAEYGVGALTTGPALILDGPAPATLTDTKLLNMLKKGFSGGKPEWGTASAQTIYLFIIPAETAFTDPASSGGDCCADMDGYHYDAMIGGTLAEYAVVCACPDEVGPNLSLADQVASTAVHEIVEAATDPHPHADTSGYGATDDDHLAWSTVLGGELADMCENNADVLFQPAGISHLVPRIWSNAAAAAGQDPCVPAPPGEPYFNSVPVMKDAIAIGDGSGGNWSTLGVKIAAGQSKTITVQLFSAAPTSGPWQVAAYDNSEYLGGKPLLSFTWSATEGTNGDTLQLTIKVLSADATVGAEMFAIESTLGEHSSMWFGAVGQ